MTLAAIAFGVVALIVSGGFVRDLYRQLREAIIHSQSGHLQVAQAAFFAEGSRSPEKYRIRELDAVEADLVTLPGVKRVMARMSFAGLMSNMRNDLPILGEGIEPDKEGELATSIVILEGSALAWKDPNDPTVLEALPMTPQLPPCQP